MKIIIQYLKKKNIYRIPGIICIRVKKNKCGLSRSSIIICVCIRNSNNYRTILDRPVKSKGFVITSNLSEILSLLLTLKFIFR